MAELPPIHVPAWIRRPSGLWVPPDLGVSPLVSVPPELLPDLTGRLLVRGGQPDWRDQVGYFITIDELGMRRPTPAEIEQLVGALPFDRVMLALSHLQRQLEHIRFDLGGQRALLDTRMPESEFKRRILKAAPSGDNAFIFSEQGLLVMQRLVLLHADPNDREITAADEAQFAYLMFSVPATLLEGSSRDSELTPEQFAERFLRFFVASGGLVGGEWLGAAIARAHMLYTVIAESEEAADHDQYCPIREWTTKHVGCSISELQATGFAAASLGKLFDEAESGPIGVLPGFMRDSAIAQIESRAINALAAPRDWFAAAFAAAPGPDYVARDFRPFYQRPFLQRDDGSILVLSPRAFREALGDHGLFFRLLDIARGERELQRFTNFNGWLFERYALQAANTAFPTDHAPAGAARVAVHGAHKYRIGRQEYETPDVTLDCGGLDLVVVEVGSSHLTVKSLIEGDSEKVQADLAKAVTDKVAQLYDRIQELVDGHTRVPDVDLANVQGIWPIVVYADSLFQTNLLWQHIADIVGDRALPEYVRPLTLLDIGSYERFLALSKTTWPIDLLRRKTLPQWQQRDFGAWFNGDPRAPRNGDSRQVVMTYLDQLMERLAEILFPGQDHKARLAEFRNKRS